MVELLLVVVTLSVHVGDLVGVAGRDRKAVRITGAVAASVGAALAFAMIVVGYLALAYDSDRGWLGRIPLLFLCASGVLAVACLLCLAVRAVSDDAGRRPARPARLLWTMAGAVPAALMAVTAVVLIATEPGWQVVRTTAAQVPIPARPDRVDRVAWRVHLPGRLFSLLPAGAGFAAETSRGVYGVSGRTGALRWSYEHHGTFPTSLTVSPDGRTVAFQLAHDDPPAQRGGAGTRNDQIVVLDATTGRTRLVSTGAVVQEGGSLGLTDLGFVVAQGADFTIDRPSLVRSYALADGAMMWQRRMSGCLTSAVTASGVVVADGCDQPRVRSLDARSGRVIWSRSLDLSADGPLAVGRFVAVPRLAKDVPRYDLTLLDPRTGHPQRNVYGNVLGLDPDAYRFTNERVLDLQSGRVVSLGSAQARAAHAGTASFPGGGFLGLVPQSSGDAVQVFSGGLTGPLHAVTVRLGADYIARYGSTLTADVTAGPGAIVVWDGIDTPRPGRPAVLVGLR